MLCAICPPCCVVDDEKEEGSCYADSETGVCDCFLGVKEYVGTNSEKVEACVGYSRCYAYVDPDLEERRCSCGDASYVPEPSSTEIVETAGCPA